MGPKVLTDAILQKYYLRRDESTNNLGVERRQ
jgi:hypothetical protein